MKKRNVLSMFGIIALVVCTFAVAYGQGCPNSTDLNDCINVRARELVKAKADQNSNTKQTEAPAASTNSTSLVDQSSASDLVGLALNLAGLTATTQSKGDTPNSVSVTTSAYALYSGFKGADPLNPDFYNAHRDWRRLSLTLGYDDEKIGTTSDTQRAKIVGLKYLLINHRDPNRKEFRTDLDQIVTRLGEATTRFSGVTNEVKTFIFKHDKVLTGIITPDFKAYLARRAIETDQAILAAQGIVLTAKQAAVTQPTNPSAVVSAVRGAAEAAVKVDPPRAIRNAARDVRNAAIDASDHPSSNDPARTVGEIVTAAEAAEANVRANKPAIIAHLDSLKKEPVNSLFVFENGLLANDSDEELREFRAEFINNYMTGAGFARIQGLLGNELYERIDAALKDLSSFTALREVSLNTIDRIRRAPQLSVAYFTKQRKVGIDEHKVEMIFDWGIANKLNLTANGSFGYLDSQVIGGDIRGGSFAVQFRYQVNHNDLYSLLGNRKPIFFDLAAEGSRRNGQASIIKGQAKLTIPLGNSGIDFPISVTVANRTALIKEKEVRGQFGFTFDIAKLAAALAPK